MLEDLVRCGVKWLEKRELPARAVRDLDAADRRREGRGYDGEHAERGSIMEFQL